MPLEKKSSVVSRAAFYLVLLIPLQAAPGATFDYLLDGGSFQQLWSTTSNWQLSGGVDDGGNGYPDGSDTLVMDRSLTSSTATRLAVEGGPPTSVAGIIGKGGNQRDVVFKFADFTLGDLEVLPSPYPSFWIWCERDRNLTINGIISGSGNLVIERGGAFSDGVDPGELITLTGSAPNTITGTIRLHNSAGFFNGSDKLQPSYWVADKVGAFGQAASLTLEGTKRSGDNDSGIASLAITANTIGGEGAIDDDVTEVYIGYRGILDVAGGVDEKIGAGKLFIDIGGTGSYTEVAPGTYDSAMEWISGSGTVTVLSPAADPRIVSITPVGGGIWELQVLGAANTNYEFRSSPDLSFAPGALLQNFAPGTPAIGTISGTNNSILTTSSEGKGTVRVNLSGSSSNFVRAQSLP